MNRVILLGLIALITNLSWGQTNIFPTSGNAGIGITNPQSQLHIIGDTHGGQLQLQFNSSRPKMGIRAYHDGNSDAMLFYTSPSGYPLALNGGKVGIGTRTPESQLHIIGDTHGGQLQLQFNSSRPKMGIRAYHDGNSDAMLFYTSPSGYPLALNGDKVGIGTRTPDAKLTVAGNVHSREVKVTINAGADFVFEKSYDLRTLEETEEFISENKHLPEIASESEMLENGLQIGEMNIKLLQKIEELTLYLIEQNKENKKQRKLIQELRKEVSALKNK